MRSNGYELGLGPIKNLEFVVGPFELFGSLVDSTFQLLIQLAQSLFGLFLSKIDPNYLLGASAKEIAINNDQNEDRDNN